MKAHGVRSGLCHDVWQFEVYTAAINISVFTKPWVQHGRNDAFGALFSRNAWTSRIINKDTLIHSFYCLFSSPPYSRGQRRQRHLFAATIPELCNINRVLWALRAYIARVVKKTRTWWSFSSLTLLPVFVMPSQGCRHACNLRWHTNSVLWYSVVHNYWQQDLNGLLLPSNMPSMPFDTCSATSITTSSVSTLCVTNFSWDGRNGGSIVPVINWLARLSGHEWMIQAQHCNVLVACCIVAQSVR